MRGPDARASLTLYLGRLEEMIGGQAYFFGAQPSIADFSIYHCLWFVLRGGPVARILEPFGRIQAWLDRMRSFGHGTQEPLDSGAAIAAAHAGSPAPSSGVDAEPDGIAAGEKVVVAATDTGTEPIDGDLYAAGGGRISITREDARAGRVAVHFPRLGFELRRASAKDR
jgi:hypothetical protein